MFSLPETVLMPLMLRFAMLPFSVEAVWHGQAVNPEDAPFVCYFEFQWMKSQSERADPNYCSCILEVTLSTGSQRHVVTVAEGIVRATFSFDHSRPLRLVSYDPTIFLHPRFNTNVRAGPTGSICANPLSDVQADVAVVKIDWTTLGLKPSQLAKAAYRWSHAGPLNKLSTLSSARDLPTLCKVIGYGPTDPFGETAGQFDRVHEGIGLLTPPENYFSDAQLRSHHAITGSNAKVIVLEFRRHTTGNRSYWPTNLPGDSGGPILCYRSNYVTKTSHYYLTGLISTGVFVGGQNVSEILGQLRNGSLYSLGVPIFEKIAADFINLVIKSFLS